MNNQPIVTSVRISADLATCSYCGKGLIEREVQLILWKKVNDRSKIAGQIPITSNYCTFCRIDVGAPSAVDSLNLSKDFFISTNVRKKRTKRVEPLYDSSGRFKYGNRDDFA